MNWSGWIPASCTGAAGSLGPETIAAVGVPFGQDSGPPGPNLIRFRVSDMAGQSSISGDLAAAVDSAPPTAPPGLWSTSHTPGTWSNPPRYRRSAIRQRFGQRCGRLLDSVGSRTGEPSGPELDTTAVVNTSSPLADAANWIGRLSDR